MRPVLPPTVGFRLVPGNYTSMKGADHHGRALESGCGHSMEMWLRLEDGRIAAASYVTDGCESFVLCGSLVAHLSQGLTLEEARFLQPVDVLAALGHDDEAARHSIDLALRSLRAAVDAPQAVLA
jgi:nitrogen fixation NifU-like protein